MSLVLESLAGHMATVKQIEALEPVIADIADRVIAALRSGGKVLLMGNGGSAADSQHLAAELVGRFKLERRAWPAIALTTDTSILTAIGNDYGMDRVFARQVEALAREGDVVIGLSTSGGSKNVVEAMKQARESGSLTVGLLGGDGGPIKSLCDIPLVVDSSDTPRVQETHILVGHILCDLIERGLTGHAD